MAASVASVAWVLRRVGLNALYLLPGRVGGTEVYARELSRALGVLRPDTQFLLFCGREAHASLVAAEWPGNVSLVQLPVRSSNKPLRIAAEYGLLPFHAAGLDLLHSLGTTSPPVTRAPRVVTVHDVIYEVHPAAFPAPARWALKALVPLGARRARRVMVHSEATKREVVAALALDAERVDVVPLGPGRDRQVEATPEAELRRRLGLGGPVILTVAAALPHKNLERLLRAFALLQGAPSLVIAGHAGRMHEHLTSLAREAGVADRVRLTGWLGDEDLEGLYRLASCFVYPSLHEGFGLPVLEAMRRGVPVACADATSLPEVAGDAALLFPPDRLDAIAAAMRELLENGDRRRELAERGVRQAARFSWERTAQLAWRCYERALAGSSRSTSRQ